MLRKISLKNTYKRVNKETSMKSKNRSVDHVSHMGGLRVFCSKLTMQHIRINTD